MGVRKKTENRLNLYRQCWICGKWFQTTADTPWVRQLYNVGGKKQKTCYFCSSACKEASYKMPHHGKGKINSEERSRKRRHTPEENRAYYAAHAEQERARTRVRYCMDPEQARANAAFSRAKAKILNPVEKREPKCKRVFCTTNGIAYNSAKEAGESLCIRPKYIRKACSGERKTACGMLFEYA